MCPVVFLLGGGGLVIDMFESVPSFSLSNEKLRLGIATPEAGVSTTGGYRRFLRFGS